MTNEQLRSLCAELLNDLEHSVSQHCLKGEIDNNPLITHARAALAAAPVPKRVEGVGELAEELELMANRAADALQFGDAHFLFRAAALLSPQVAPQQGVPSDVAIREMWLSGDWFNEGATLREFTSIIRRYGAPTVPVPVAERLPGEGDLKDGRCWYGAPDRRGGVAG